MSLFKKSEPIPQESLLFSRKALIKLIVPLILQQILGVSVGMADSMMVSYAGEAAVSGVSLIHTLDTLLIIFFTALVSGGSVVIAQALGKKHAGNVHEAAKQLIYSATVMATLLSVAVLLLRGPLLNLLFGDAEPDVLDNAMRYFSVVAFSFPLLAVIESIAACFRAAGNSFITLLVSLAINAMNIIGNAVLIYVFDMGAVGAALATVLSRLVGAVILIVLIQQKKHPVHVKKLLHYKPDFAIIKRILHIGVPNGIENSMFQFGRLLTQSLISSMGTAVIAGNAVALTLANFQYMTGNACGGAMIPVVGRCIGAGEKKQAKYYSRKILILNYIFLGAVILVTLLFLKPLVSLYGLSGDSSALAQRLVIWHCVIAILIWPVGFMLPSAFRAASDVRFCMVISMISMWVFRVLGAYVLALDTVSVFGLFSFPGAGLGITGVWIAMFIDWAFRSSLFFIRYLSGKWLRVRKEI